MRSTEWGAMESESESDISLCHVQLTVDEPHVKRFRCHYEGCWTAYDRQWKLDRHICTHTKERPFKCTYPDCTKDYRSNSHLQRHISVSHKKTDKTKPSYLKCPHPGCNLQYQNKYSLKKHYKRHLVGDPYRCDECDETFKKRRQLVRHSYEHTGKYPHVCCKCQKGFATLKELNHHERRHKVYVCEYEGCRQEFPGWSFLNKHFKLKHPRTYECDTCKRKYVSKYALVKHMLTHLPDGTPDRFLCPYDNCLKYYRYKYNLKHHIATAHEGKRYKCEEENCNKEFVTKARLVGHQMKHKDGTLDAVHPEPQRDKKRKPRKDKGLPQRSKAAYLSGIILPRKVERRLAQKKITPEVEESIKKTCDYLRELDSDKQDSDDDDDDDDALDKSRNNLEIIPC